MKKMQLKEVVEHCNGCGACVVGCKYVCVKMEKDENGISYPTVNEDGCRKCNNCVLYCPVYNPVELPIFETFYDSNKELEERDMPSVYRETMRSIKEGKHTEFIGTLCQIAALKSLRGDKLDSNLVLFPLYCDKENPKRPECAHCKYAK